MPPVCSPREIIGITIGGNTFDLASGAAIVSPPAIEARDSMTALWITMFPAVRAVISRPSRIDTPDEIRVPSVRVKRDTAALRSTSPRMGVLRSSESICSRPGAVLYQHHTALTRARASAPPTPQQHLHLQLAPLPLLAKTGSS